jgi:PncC family amidohydrolase
VLHRLTNVAGSSAYVVGGVVAYANAVKMALLNVPADTLENYGAVSQETAAAMVHGALALFDVDVAVSVTGIAGPGGALPNKPVGLTYFGIATRHGFFKVEHHVWQGDRETIKQQSADQALRLIIEATHSA